MPPMMSIGEVVLGRYQVSDIVATGGQATIGKATCQVTGNTVIVKQLSLSSNAPHYAIEVARFARGAAVHISHPVIVNPIDTGEERGQHYIIMPYIDGDDLDIYVAKRGGRLSVAESCKIMDQVLGGLAAVHSKGIVHRDIKPANILVTATLDARIIDFGICRLTKERTLTCQPGLVGTLQWASPEQLRDSASVDHRSDIYSAGHVLYWLLTGVVLTATGPSRGSASPRDVDVSIPEHVDRACRMALASAPQARFQSVEEFQHVLLRRSVAPLSYIVCLSCGSFVAGHSNYCPTCGCTADKRNDMIICLACGAPVGDATVCPSCTKSFGNTNHQLTGLSGTLTGCRFRIPQGCYDVGRKQLSARDARISRCQMRVSCLNGSVLIEDAGAKNMTWVAGCQAAYPMPLIPHQVLDIAGNTAVYTTR